LTSLQHKLIIEEIRKEQYLKDDATFAFLVRILTDIIAMLNEINNLLG
jgi:hypothetical protein